MSRAVDFSRVAHQRLFLLEAALAPSTRGKYRNAVRLFVEWCDRNGEKFDTVEELDDLVLDYLHYLFLERDGKGLWLGRSTMYGLIMLMPAARGKLLVSATALRGWQRLHPSIRYPPLTWELAVVIAVQLVRHERWDMAVGTVLAFDCMLRVGELVSLVREDVADAGDARLNASDRHMQLCLRHTKTGDNKWTWVELEPVKILLRELLRRTAKRARLFAFSAQYFRQVFKHVCVELGLSERYVPHSLRHGGATFMHRAGRSLSDIRHRGRWAQSKSAEHYIQAGPALLLQTAVPEAVAARASLMARDVVSSFSLAQNH
ncbi:MAG TPA: site-specific integrase [Oculatellaceae cyanobacterium]